MNWVPHDYFENDVQEQRATPSAWVVPDEFERPTLARLDGTPGDPLFDGDVKLFQNREGEGVWPEPQAFRFDRNAGAYVQVPT